MNTDEVRKRFEKELSKELYSNDMFPVPRTIRAMTSFAFKWHQQATKDMQAEIEKLGGHITYLRDEIAEEVEISNAVAIKLTAANAENERLRSVLYEIRSKALSEWSGRQEVWDIADEALKEADR